MRSLFEWDHKVQCDRLVGWVDERKPNKNLEINQLKYHTPPLFPKAITLFVECDRSPCLRCPKTVSFPETLGNFGTKQTPPIQNSQYLKVILFPF